MISLSLVDLHHCRYLSLLCLQGFRNYFCDNLHDHVAVGLFEQKNLYKSNITNEYIRLFDKRLMTVLFNFSVFEKF